MKIGELTTDQKFRYFDVRLQGKLRKVGFGHMAPCPWHEDRKPSMSVNVEKGIWKCHGPCNEGGGILAFEKKFLGGDDQDALARIVEIIGEKQLTIGSGNQSVERVYQYQDAYGRVLFEKLRYPGKRFVQRRVIDAKKGEYEYKLGNVQKPLYHLPEVLTSDQVWIAEGEKDVDNLREIFRNGEAKVTATTNFDGAGKWRDEYAPYFTGKRVVVCADNDAVGEKHAELVARSLHRYAAGVKVIRFPELEPKQDVSDFLKAHKPEELILKVKATPLWHPPEQDTSYFMPSGKFASLSAADVEWLVGGIIQKHVNGMLLADPKSAKSFVSLDLAIALASGQCWLGTEVDQAVKVGVISREDFYGSTSWRHNRICEGRSIHPSDLDEMLYFNTKVTVPKLLLDNDESCKELLRQIESRRLEFLVFDVLRKLHMSDENSNNEMEAVIEKLDEIKSRTGAQILLLHHLSKNGDGSVTKRSRGATAIYGWAEYAMGLTVLETEEEYTVRQLEFELKAGNKPKPKKFQIVDLHRDDCANKEKCSCPRRLDLVRGGD
jgi:5S rRNA maturation endonuclease (ribonuclease M5)